VARSMTLVHRAVSSTTAPPPHRLRQWQRGVNHHRVAPSASRRAKTGTTGVRVRTARSAMCARSRRAAEESRRTRPRAGAASVHQVIPIIRPRRQRLEDRAQSAALRSARHRCSGAISGQRVEPRPRRAAARRSTGESPVKRCAAASGSQLRGGREHERAAVRGMALEMLDASRRMRSSVTSSGARGPGQLDQRHAEVLRACRAQARAWPGAAARDRRGRGCRARAGAAAGAT